MLTIILYLKRTAETSEAFRGALTVEYEDFSIFTLYKGLITELYKGSESTFAFNASQLEPLKPF